MHCLMFIFVAAVYRCQSKSIMVIVYIVGVFLWFNNSIFPNSSQVLASKLQPIQCHSDNSKEIQPEWRFPNGTRIHLNSAMVATSHNGHVTLKQVDNSTSIPLGQYCCLAQDARRRSHTLCVNIISGNEELHRL